MRKRFIAGLLVVLLSPMLAWPQQGSIELKSVSEVEVVTKDAQGKTVVNRVEAAKSKVVPGNVVIITTTYRNIGTMPADNVAITNPIPQHTFYVDLSASGKDTRIDFSIDGGKTYNAPEKLTAKDDQGRTRPALPVDYTDIRWTRSKQLKPGESGSVSFRTRIK